MAKRNVGQPTAAVKKSEMRRIEYPGSYQIGDIVIECAVLDDGTHGYTQAGLNQVVGFKGNILILRFERFLAEIDHNLLEQFRKSRSQVLRKAGGRAWFVEAGILTKIAGAVARAAIEGRLHTQRRHILPVIMDLLEVLGTVGEHGIIGEATGFQYHRPNDYLAELINRLLLDQARDWERRFHPDFYRAVCPLFGIRYDGNKHRALPSCIGAFTLEFVYEPSFPTDVLAEVRDRRNHEKLHQWLSDVGTGVVIRQIDKVTAVAETCVDYADFRDRWYAVHGKAGRQIPLVLPMGSA